MGKYDNQMDLDGAKESGECYFHFGTLKLDDHLVLIDRAHLVALERVAHQARTLVDDLDASYFSTTADTDETVMALRESLVALDDEEQK